MLEKTKKAVIVCLSWTVAEATVQEAAAQRMAVDVDIAAFYMQLPEVNFTTASREDFTTQSKITDHDGDVDGQRVRGSLRGIAFGDASDWTFGFSGFFATGENTQAGICNGISGQRRCGWVDPFSPTEKVGFAFGDDVATSAVRAVDYWGMSLVASLPADVLAVLPNFGLFEWVDVGFDYRRLDQKLTIRAHEVTEPTNRMHYQETIDTDYWGVFVASGSTKLFSDGWFASYSAQVGLYYADASLSGQYADTVVPDLGEGSFSVHDVAALGALRADVGKQFDQLTVSLYGELEGISWTPKVDYRDVEPHSNGVFNSTSVKASSFGAFDTASWMAAAGIRIKVPLR